MEKLEYKAFRKCFIPLLAFVLAMGKPVIAAAGVTPSLYQSFAGNLNWTGTGASLRTEPDSVDPCAVTNTSTAELSGLPAGAIVKAAYLYWAGSYDGVSPDFDITFDGNSISASRTWTDSANISRNIWIIYWTEVVNFFSGFADVTSIVAARGNGVYSFGGLSVNNAYPHCTGIISGDDTVVSGWSLVVIYEDSAEPFRIVNVYDGFQYFQNSQLNLTPGNFLIPATGIDGTLGYISWEGDDGISGGGENLNFNGNNLTDGINPGNNQYNSTINLLGSTTSYGVDFDAYDITSYLSPGDTSAASTHRTRDDLVLLSAEIISVTNTEVADLEIVKSHTGDFTLNQTGSYTILVSNNGPDEEVSSITVYDTLPAGLTYLSSGGTGWVVDTTADPTITWTHPGPLASGGSLPAITLSVSVLPGAAPSVTNTASVESSTFDNISENDTSSDPTTVLHSNLSGSTKTVVDLDGGDAEPGDILRYTVTLVDSGGLATSSAAVTDNLPAGATSLSIVSYPAGAIDNSTSVLVDISDISVPAWGSETIVFDVTIAGSVSPGDTIDNTASILNPGGVGGNPAAPTVVIQQSEVPSTGNKPLYLGTNTLSRTEPGVLPDVVVGQGVTFDWVLDPALATTLTMDGSTGQIPVTLVLGETGLGQNRSYTISLSSSTGGTFATLSLTNEDLNPTVTATYNLPLTAPGDITLPAGSTIILSVTNNSAPNREITVAPNGSFVDLPCNTVINVDSVRFYDSAYPGGIPVTTAVPGSTVYVRAVVSDPFGSFDITSSNITILPPLGAPVVSGVAMTEAADSGGATKTFEYGFTVPGAGPVGTWTAQVVAAEGSEGEVIHQRNATWMVALPMLSSTKMMQVVNDPVNGAANPKAIPGAQIGYTLYIMNIGLGAASTDSVVITDAVPNGTDLFVGDLGGAGSGPALFTDGSTASGLSYTFIGLSSSADDIDFSNNGGLTFTHTPVPDGDGYDTSVPPVDAIRINPKGIFNSSDGVSHPSFNLRYQIRIQ